MFLVSRSLMRLNHGFEIKQIDRMVNVGVCIRPHPQTEVLAAMVMPPRRITRRQTIDARHIDGAPAPVDRRRLTMHLTGQFALQNATVNFFFLNFILGEIGEIIYKLYKQLVEPLAPQSEGQSIAEEPPAKRPRLTDVQSSSQVNCLHFFFAFFGW